MANPTPEDVNTAIKYNARQRAIDDAKFVMELNRGTGATATAEVLLETAAKIEHYYLNEIEVKAASSIIKPRSN